MWLSNDGTYKSWLKRVKSGKSQFKWLQSTASRYYCINFKTQTFYYSHSEEQKDISQPIAFQDIVGAELRKAVLAQGGKSGGESGFIIKTAGRSIELYAPSELLASQWVETLNAARDSAVASKTSNGTHSTPSKRINGTSPSASSPLRADAGQAGGPSFDMDAEQEARSRDSLREFPCHIRRAAYQRQQPQWPSMTWGERLREVQSFAHEHGFVVSHDMGDEIRSEVSSSSFWRSPDTEAMPSRVRRRRPPILDPMAEDRMSLELQNRFGEAATSSAGYGPTSQQPHGADVEERCRQVLVKMSCSIRSSAAAQHSDWGKMSWTDRFSVVRSFCLQNGLEFEDVPMQPAAPHWQQPSHAPPLPPPSQPPGAADSWGPSLPQQMLQSYAASSPGTGALSSSWKAALAPHGGHAGLSDGGRQQMSAYQPGAMSAETAHRLKAIFSYSDSLHVLVGHHLQTLEQAVIEAMVPRAVARGEVLIEQGTEGRSVFIVDEGAFDVVIRYGHAPAVKICSYGPGSVFGEHAMLSDKPRAASVVATSPGSVWYLEREAFRNILKAPEDTKTIGLIGGVMLLINNLAGPTIVSMPALAQEAGWLSVILVQVVVAAFACICGYMLIASMRKMPGNQNFEQRIEFSNLAKFYLPHEIYIFVMLCYHTNSILSLMSLIIQSGQVIDYVILNLNGCAPGLALGGQRGIGYMCGTRTDSVTPFGDTMVLSSSMIVVGVICGPLAMKNLDDNVALQYLAIAGLCVMAVIWIVILVAEPAFPTTLPVMTTSQGSLIGTVLFNFAFTAALPSWVNEKKNNVSIGMSFGITMVFVVVIYSVIGILGGMAYKPFYETDENLFSKLNAGGSKLGQATVTAYPMLQNFTSIPVFSILIRYNLLQSGISAHMATMIAVVLPWVLSIAFYSGGGFDMIAEWGGLATSSVINFLIPGIIYALARGRTSDTVA